MKTLNRWLAWMKRSGGPHRKDLFARLMKSPAMNKAFSRSKWVLLRPEDIGM